MAVARWITFFLSLHTQQQTLSDLSLGKITRKMVIYSLNWSFWLHESSLPTLMMLAVRFHQQLMSDALAHMQGRSPSEKRVSFAHKTLSFRHLRCFKRKFHVVVKWRWLYQTWFVCVFSRVLASNTRRGSSSSQCFLLPMQSRVFCLFFL